MCRIFRSDVKRMHGAWPEAEAEALQASVELRGYIPGAAGLALYQIGEIRLRRGDLPAAEEALLGAHGLGQDTEPALSLLRLAQGKTAAAVESIRRALQRAGPPVLASAVRQRGLSAHAAAGAGRDPAGRRRRRGCARGRRRARLPG